MGIHLQPAADRDFRGPGRSPRHSGLHTFAGIAFLLRQPLTTIVKIYSGRRARTDLPAALFWMLACGLIGLFEFAALAVLGDGFAA